MCEEPPTAARPLMMAEQPAVPGAGSVTHYVSDEQMRAAGLGLRPRAVCGRAFPPACLATPLGPTCPACASTGRAPAVGRGSGRRLRVPRWLPVLRSRRRTR